MYIRFILFILLSLFWVRMKAHIYQVSVQLIWPEAIGIYDLSLQNIDFSVYLSKYDIFIIWAPFLIQDLSFLNNHWRRAEDFLDSCKNLEEITCELLVLESLF